MLRCLSDTNFDGRFSGSLKHSSLHRHRPRPRLIEALERREVLDASLQVIHNSPYDDAALVDVYVNDALLLSE